MVDAPGYRQNGAIRASDYNTLRAAVDRVYGVGYGDSGYGQTAIAIPYMTPGRAIWHDEWQILRNAVEVCLRHQDNAVSAMLPPASEYISNVAVKADQSVPPTSSARDLVGAISRIEAERLNWFAPGGGGTEPWTTSYGASWSSLAVMTFEIHFPSNDEARFWFNSGNSVSLRPSFIPGDGSGQSYSWADFLGHLPILYINVGAVHDSDGVGRHPGYYGLPVFPAPASRIFSATYTGTGTAGGRNLADFTGNVYEVWCRVRNDNPADPNGSPGRILEFTVRFHDIFTATQVGDNDLVVGTLRVQIGYAWSLLVQIEPVALNPDGTQPKLYCRPPLGLTGESGSAGPTTDITPEYFAFIDQTGVEPDTMIYSNVLVVSGINTAAPIQVDNAEMSINGGGWVTSGRINNGQTLQLRTVSPNFSLERTTATVRMTGFITNWMVETKYFVRFVDFLTPGNYTWTVPNSRKLVLEVVGGGGGGGSGSEDHYFGDKNAGGGGGGGSGGRHTVQVAVTPGEILSISVGAGGLGSKTQSQNGNPGNSTTVSGSFGSYTATGGGGGQKGDANPAPPKGGTAGTPNGNTGGNGLVLAWIAAGGIGAASPSVYGTGQMTPIAQNGILGAGGGGSTAYNRNFGNFPAGDGGHGFVRIDY